MNVLLTTSAAPEKSPFFTNEKRPPLGVGILISLLRKEGHNVFFIDNYLKPNSFIEEGYLQKNSIEIVGIHTNTNCYRDAVRMFCAIEDLRKKGLWKGKIIVGGPHTSVANDTIPEFVDHIVQGEGEKAILHIVNSGVKERVIKQERICDLDSLPFQPWDIFNSLPYDYSCPWMEIQPVFTMNTSRGCPFSCNFCSVGSIWGKQYTYFSADRIIAEIEYLIKEYEARGIYFREDNFTLNLKRTEDICETMIRKNMNVSWACETRVSNTSENLIRLMSAAGCKALYLGVESGSEGVLQKLNKGITLEQIENTVIWCRKYGVRTYCSLIVGTPDDTHKDYLLTKRLMQRLKPYKYAFNIYVGLPGSSLYQHILQNHLHEYRDDLDLLYLPGYHIKTRYFYAMDSKNFVDYEFQEITPFDNKLLGDLKRKNFIRKTYHFLKNIFRFLLPKRIRSIMKKYQKQLLNQLN